MRSALLTVVLALAALTCLPAWALAQETADDSGAGAIMLDQLSKDVEVFMTQREGITVFYILPRGWAVAEQGVDPKTGELDPRMHRYIVGSRSPVADEKEAPDMVFELSIYSEGLLINMPAGLTKEQQAEYEAQQFWKFLQIQMNDATTSGLKCTSEAADIVPKPYGTGTRAPTFFVPIYYETDNGSQIYTFSSSTGGKIWTLRFLLKPEQVENYGALIALILANTFAMTDADYAEWQKKYGQQTVGPPAPEQTK